MTLRIHTELTSALGLSLPIVGAPMGGVSGAALCAAVSRAGALGMIGAGYGDLDWMRHELDALRQLHLKEPWGIGVITWSTSDELLDRVLDARPDVVMVSFGDPARLIDRIKRAGIKAMAQVQSVAAARKARDAGADLIVAQGTEAGGHGACRSSLPLVPAVVDAVHPLPVLAAGGIADGRGMAAALMLGAQGVLIGTRLYASTEALGHPNAKDRLVSASGDETIRTRVFDIVRNLPWPSEFTGRSIRNDFSESWDGREQDLAGSAERFRDDFQQAQATGDLSTAMVWAGEVIDLVRSVKPAGEIVREIDLEAAELLNTAQRLLRPNERVCERGELT